MVALLLPLLASGAIFGCAQSSNSAPEGTGGESAGGENTDGKEPQPGLSYGADAQKVYERGVRGVKAGGCEYAIGDFNEVRRKYPYSRFAALSELRIADCQLKQGEHILAIQSYRQFVRHRPSHAEVPYAHLQVAVAYAEQIPPNIFFMPPASELDPKPAREALRQAQRFVADYPAHERVDEAKEIVDRAIQILAGHELYAARFYMKRKAFEGVVARIKAMMLTYPENPFAAEGLLLLGKAHLALKDRPKAREALQELRDRLPDSDEAKEAGTLLQKLGATAQSAPSTSAPRASAEAPSD